MRTIDLETWPRREHYEFFRTWDRPQFSVSANVDLTELYRAVKQRGHSITVAIVYVVTRAANAIPEFRQRLREGGVVEHEVVHPAATIPAEDDTFSFCAFEYDEDYSRFVPRAAEHIAYVREHPGLEEGVEDDNMLYMTAIPWVSFTGFVHPMIGPEDCVPRIAWGKFFRDGESLMMPLNVQAHHALVDGLHVGRFFEKVQDYMSHPDFVLAQG